MVVIKTIAIKTIVTKMFYVVLLYKIHKIAAPRNGLLGREIKTIF
jgi:hypothetical protein